MKKLLALILVATGLGACSSGVNSEFAELYTGHEGGSWYHYSHNCSAQLCPPN